MTRDIWKITLWIVFAMLATFVGMYPASYFIFDMSQGLLATKSDALLQDTVWKALFKTHIVFAGISLLIGWTQYIPWIRRNHLTIHRTVGKVYITTCLLGGLSGLYIAIYATGGWISSLGFGTLGLLWLITTMRAYLAIRQKQVNIHRAWMIRSYALTFAAVTLRIWLPFSLFVLHIDYFTAYPVISWLCWVPNLFVAELLIRNELTR
jgi:uncharacterized membrane protein